MRPIILSLILATSPVKAYSYSSRAFAELRDLKVVESRSTALLGDLLTTRHLTTSGTAIKNALEGITSALAADTTTYTRPGAPGSPACNEDKCCIWSYIASDMHSAFRDESACTSLARGAIRLGFHDAAAWNSTLNHGGADGSILLSAIELSRRENNGLAAIAAQTSTWFAQYGPYGIGMADLIQMGAVVATLSCPGGPRIRAFVGREDSDRVPPAGLLPSPFDGAEVNIALFRAKTFSASDLVALVGAHTVSNQFFVDPDQAGKGQDSSEGVFDVRFYKETLGRSTPVGVFKFPSDVALSNDSATKGTWTAFAGSKSAWVKAYAPAYFRMSLLGVNNLNYLTECSRILPASL